MAGNVSAAEEPLFRRRFLSLAATELLERFAVSGVKSILVLIFVDRLLVGDTARVVGATAFQHASAAMFGPVSVIGLASQLYGYASALLYLAVPIGGLIGDLIDNRRAMVAVGGAGMLIGLMLMLGDATFLIGLVPFAIGAGLLKGNLSAQVGALFVDEAQRRRGYSVYLGFLNAGAIGGPLVCGALAAFVGVPYAIGAAATAIALGLALYGTVGRAAPAVQAPPPSAGSSGTTGASALLVVALTAAYLCYAAYDQLGNVFLVWARVRADRHIFGWAMPVAWFLALDGIFTLMLIAASEAASRAMGRRGAGIGALTQIFLGGIFCAAGYVVLALGDATSGGAPLALPWTLGYLLLIDAAIVLIWPSALSLIAGVAPRRLVGFWMGIFYLHGFFSSLWAGFSGVYYDRIGSPHFWLLHAVVAGAGALLILIAGPPLLRARRARQAITTSACAKAGA